MTAVGRLLSPRICGWIVLFLIFGGLGFRSGLEVRSARAFYLNPSYCSYSYAGGSSLLYLDYRPATGSETPAGIYYDAFYAARGSWFWTNTPVVFSLASSTGSTHGVSTNGNQQLLGWTTTPSNNPCVWSQIRLNTTALNSAYWPHDFWKQYAAAHEMGHHVRLDHTSSHPAILYSPPNDAFRTASYPQGGWNGPLADDECGTNSKYSSTNWPPTCGYGSD